MNKTFWNNKNVLITGHTGFKGSWLSLLLNKLGSNVFGLSLEEPVTTPNLFSVLNINSLVDDGRGDINQLESCISIMQNAKPEIIFHLAAQPLVRKSYKSPISTYMTNIIGTANILEAARFCDSVKTIVIVTTDKCYENIEKSFGYTETDPLGGYDPYSSSKACAEHVSSAYFRSFFKDKGVGLATARAGNIIGGGDWSADRLIPDIVKSFFKNEKLIIRYPKATRPWQYVLDPLRGYLMLADSLYGKPDDFSGAWNFGPDQNSVKTVQDTVENAVQIWGGGVSWTASKRQKLA